jgi:hypothetical protein
MEKDRRDESPDFAVVDLVVGLHPKGQHRRGVLRAAGERHHKEDDDIQAKERVRGNGTASPKSAYKVEFLFFDHDKWSLTLTVSCPQLSCNFTRSIPCFFQLFRLEGNCGHHSMAASAVLLTQLRKVLGTFL